jgi:hypothetical protein
MKKKRKPNPLDPPPGSITPEVRAHWAAQRARGEAAIYHHPDGYWLIEYEIDLDDTREEVLDKFMAFVDKHQLAKD